MEQRTLTESNQESSQGPQRQNQSRQEESNHRQFESAGFGLEKHHHTSEKSGGSSTMQPRHQGHYQQNAYEHPPPQQTYNQRTYTNYPDENQNLSNVVDRVDHFQGEDPSKIMTFKSQEHGLLGQPDHEHHHAEVRQDNPSAYPYPNPNQIGYQFSQPTPTDNQPQHVQYQFSQPMQQDQNFDKRASQGTLSHMTNPFRTKNYGYAGDQTNNTMLSYQNELQRTDGQNNDYGQRDNQAADEFSSPEENRTMPLQKQESQTDQGNESSSSMSGYDLKGMLSRAQNQAKADEDNYGMSTQNKH